MIGVNESGEACSKQAQSLAKRVCLQATTTLEPLVSALLTDFLIHPSESATNLNERVYEVIYQLQNCAPAMLVSVLPHLNTKMIVRDVAERRPVVELLAKLFAENIQLYSDQYSLYLNFLGRFKDQEPPIRCILGTRPALFALGLLMDLVDSVEFAKHMILRSSDLKLREDIGRHLTDRLRDLDESVRTLAVESVVEICIESDLEKLPSLDILGEVLLRTRDRKATIRLKAIEGIASVWRLAHDKWDLKKARSQPTGAVGWTKERRKFFNSIPVRIFACYAVPDLEDKLKVDELLASDFCPSSLEPDVRAKRLLELFVSLSAETNGRELFHRFLHEKKIFREVLIQALGAGADKALGQRCKEVLAQMVPGSEQISKLLGDEGVVRSLRLVAGGGAATENDVSTQDKKVRSAINSVQAHFASKPTKLKAFVSNVLTKASVGFFDRLSAVELVGLVQSAVEEDDEAELDRSLSLLEALASFLPTLFVGAPAQTILGIAKSKRLSSKFAERALLVLSKVSKNMTTGEDGDGGHTEKSRKSLFAFCYKGTPAQAKWTIRSLLGASIDLNATASSLAADIWSKHLKGSAPDSGVWEPAFASLRQIAKSCRGKTTEKNSVMKFLRSAANMALEDCLLVKSASAEFADAKAQAATFVAEFCILNSSSNGPLSSSPNPKAGKTKTTPEQDFLKRSVDAILRLMLIKGPGASSLAVSDCIGAVAAVLKLARCKPIDSHHLGFAGAEALAVVANAGPVDLRRSVSAALAKRIVEPHLPLKYSAASAFFAADSDKKCSAPSKTAIRTAIEVRRKFKTDSEEKLQKQIDDLPEDEGSALLARTYATILPEYVLPWLVYLIAHREWFGDVESDESDKVKAALDRAAHVLHVVIDNLCTGVDNYSFIQQMLLDIKLATDVMYPDSTNIQVVSELANLLVDRKLHKAAGQASVKPSEVPPVILLPAALFGNPDTNSQMDGTSLKLVERAFLPKTYHLPSLSSEVAKLPTLQTKPKSGKRKRAAKPKTAPAAAHLSDEEATGSFSSESSDEENSRKLLSKRRKVQESTDSGEPESSEDEENDKMDVDMPHSPANDRGTPRRAAAGKADQLRAQQRKTSVAAKKREKQEDDEAFESESESSKSPEPPVPVMKKATRAPRNVIAAQKPAVKKSTAKKAAPRKK